MIQLKNFGSAFGLYERSATSMGAMPELIGVVLSKPDAETWVCLSDDYETTREYHEIPLLADRHTTGVHVTAKEEDEKTAK